MPPGAFHDRSVTQGRGGARDRAPSQRTCQGRPYDNENSRDRGHSTSSNTDNTHTDPSLEQVSPLGDRYGQRRTNLDIDGTRADFGQKKRATCDAITASLIRPSKRRRELRNEEAEELYHAARALPRIIGPFVSVQETILTGVDLETQRANGIRVPSTSKNIRITEDYQAILESVRGLEDQIRWTLENRSDAINDLAAMLERASTKGRTDDCGSIRDNGLKYIPRVEGIPDLEPHVKKERRGFHHHATARLLCPRHLRDYFDGNREGLCRQILEGTLRVTHNDLPSFLYPKDLYNPHRIDEDLLRSQFMLACYRHIFTGPRTAMKETPGRSAGRKCIADLYDMRKVTPQTLAYVAVLCRHILNAKESWTNDDGAGFIAEKFYQNIISLFEDDDVWAQETLDWWNDRVFGDDCQDERATSVEPQDTEFRRLTQQRAERRHAQASSSQTHASAPRDSEDQAADDSDLD